VPDPRRSAFALGPLAAAWYVTTSRGNPPEPFGPDPDLAVESVDGPVEELTSAGGGASPYRTSSSDRTVSDMIQAVSLSGSPMRIA